MTYEAVLAALADPTRRAILEMLREQPLSVSEVADEMPVSRPAVSQHLRVLREANLVFERQEGTRRYYEVSPEGLEQLRRYLEQFWGDVLVSFEAKAKEAAKKPAKRRRK